MKSLIKHFLYLVLTLFFFIGFISCGDDDYKNPCTDTKPFKASFKMGMKVNLEGFTKPERFDTLFVSDTVLTGNVTFIAEKGYDSYHWTIGGDTTKFITRKVSLYFPEEEDRIKIQLIGKNKPNLHCFPQDDGVDTVIQYLTVIRRQDNPLIGKYRGYIKSDPKKEFDVEIKKIDFYGTVIHNINNGCWPYISQTYKLLSGYSGFKVYCFASSYEFNHYFGKNGCSDPRGIATLDKSGKGITIKFSTGEEEYLKSMKYENRKHHLFIGKKIK